MRRTLLLFLLAACTAFPAFALERPFPPQSKRGKMTPAPYPQILIDDRVRHLTPGARVWNEQNLIEMPASLRGSELPVNYTETDQGDIDRIWILTPEEAQQPLKEQRKTQ